MSKVLFVTASMMPNSSKSRQIAAELVETLRSASPHIETVERHLDPSTIPHLSGDTLAALSTAQDKRTVEQQAAVRFADSLIEEVEAADVLVLATPMYNFSIPSTLKAWLDHIARAGRTFRYTANGPEGLLKNKKVYVVVSRGGYYTGESPTRVFDFQEPYLRAFLGFVGLDNVRFIHVEGQAISPDAASKGLLAARAQIGTALAPAA
jgi:FMN-dependent NADH-azoreductase